ncbi:MAG TPA: adenosylcobinamide amidohydrolase, partial [Methanoculleus sp.]|nr:adenosylcobinamide amidohydrolase [Methanoculleus sp.]
MRHFVRDDTLFLRGRFRAASTGINGGIADVTTVLNHTVSRDFCDEPQRYLELLAARHGLFHEYFGLLTAVEMRHLCVLQYDFITVFITAGVTNPTPPVDNAPHTINIVVHSREGICDAALLETIVTVTGAKARALHDLGYDFPGTTTDAVVVACERDAPGAHTYAGTLTEAGRRV